jgi:hypothetical protein
MLLSHKVTAVIPTIPPRAHKLNGLCLPSVMRQDYPVSAISIAVDNEGAGAPTNRTNAVNAVATEWIAFLDDDDAWHKDHLGLLVDCQIATNADLVFPWFNCIGGRDPFPQHFGREWDITPDNLDEIRQFPITVLARTELIKSVGGFTPVMEDGKLWDGQRAGEDLACWVNCVKAGAKIVHLPERTWDWYHWGGNLSGRDWTRTK